MAKKKSADTAKEKSQSESVKNTGSEKSETKRKRSGTSSAAEKTDSVSNKKSQKQKDGSASPTSSKTAATPLKEDASNTTENKKSKASPTPDTADKADIGVSADEKKGTKSRTKSQKKAKSEKADDRVVEDENSGKSTAKKSKQKAKKSDAAPALSEEKNDADDGTLFASVPEGDEIFKLTTIDDIDDSAASNIEAAAIAALPRTEVDPELLLDDMGIEDTHESAEENAKYEAYLADYKEIMARMLRDAQSDEVKEARLAKRASAEEDDISKFIVTDDFFEDDEELYDEDEYITPEEIGLTEEELEKYAEPEDEAEEDTLAPESDEQPPFESDDGYDVSIEAPIKEVADTDLALEESNADEEAENESLDQTDKDGSELNELDSEVADKSDEDIKEAFPDISLREYMPGYSEQLIPEDVSDSDADSDEDTDQDALDKEESEYGEEDEGYDGAEQLEMSFDEDEEEIEYEEEIEEFYSPDKPRFIDKVFELVELVAYTFAVIMIITSFFVRHSVVEGRSMQNTLSDSDVVIISDFLYTPERGDIVVFEDYSVSTTPLIKRIIGIEGDTVEIKADGTVLVNGEILTENYVHLSHDWIPKAAIYKVGEGEVFVLGDHRNLSMDSEDFGTVRADSIIGRVLFRLFPFDSFGTVE